MPVEVRAVARPDLPPILMPDRFRLDVSYFMAVPGEDGVPPLPPGEYWVRLDDTRRWLEDGVFLVPSPLDSQNRAEVELSDEQEDWLRWMAANQIEHIRVGSVVR